jgi:GT2 family glycosyltransferase
VAVNLAAAASRVSVIVLTYNRRETLRATLRKLAALPADMPVAVVDNASQDGSAQMVEREFPHVTVLRSSSNIGAAARNLGAAWASTPYVAFCDDDTWWHGASLPLAADLLDRHPRIGALTARVLVVREDGHGNGNLRIDPASVEMSASPLPSGGLPGRSILGLMAGATIFRTAAYRAAGGYDPRFFIGGEEALLALDMVTLGWHLVYAPELVVYHRPSPLREAGLRRQLLARNAIWAAWLRLPFRPALSHTMRTLPALLREGGVTACVDLCRGLPWVMRERVVIPPRVERMRRAVMAASGRR